MAKKKKQTKTFGGYVIDRMGSLTLGAIIFTWGAVIEDNALLFLGGYLMLAWHVDQRIINNKVSVDSRKLASMIIKHINLGIKNIEKVVAERDAEPKKSKKGKK